MFSILIVDDHKHLVESLAATIPWAQHDISRVYTGYSGEQALETIKAHDIHILVTDIRMPGMSGLELVERAQALSPGIDSILLTGHAQFEYAKKAFELRAVNYLVKPLRDEELLRTVASIVDRRKTRIRELAELESLQEAVQVKVPLLQADLLEAKANAELSILEERDRIAGDIHDIIGHTLTTTLVQIEAARMLLSKDEQEGLLRLEKSQQLVRKSLNEIRGAVGLLKTEQSSADLENELRGFIADAEQIADIAVDCVFELPEPVTDNACRKVVYHALREGITNGIRHGGSANFRLRLSLRNSVLVFSLWNDGTPYNGQETGFGLNTMSERVARLGGTMRLSACAEPAGTLLELQVPLL